jgi:hypothetical protein
MVDVVKSSDGLSLENGYSLLARKRLGLGNFNKENVPPLHLTILS